MESFEEVVAFVLNHEGYWVKPHVQVQLSAEEKMAVGLKPSAPNTVTLDLVALKFLPRPRSLELVVVECKNYTFNDAFNVSNFVTNRKDAYRLFHNRRFWETVAGKVANKVGPCPAP